MRSSFALLGHNSVSGFTFRDARMYTNQDSGTALIMLGVPWDRARPDYSIAAPSISHVVISENVFDKPFYAVSNGGLSIDHLFVSNNEFGAFKTALSWEGETHQMSLTTTTIVIQSSPTIGFSPVAISMPPSAKEQ